MKLKHDSKVLEVQEIENRITNQVFDSYLDENDRKKLLEDARTFHYSETKISIVQHLFNNFNTDTVKYNDAVDIIDMETHIEQHRKNEGFFSKIANVVIPEDEQQ